MGCINSKQIEELKKKAEERQKLQKVWTDLAIKEKKDHEGEEVTIEYLRVKDVQLYAKMLGCFEAGSWGKMKTTLEKPVDIPAALPAAVKKRYACPVPDGCANDLQWNAAVQPDQTFIDAVIAYHDANDNSFVALRVASAVCNALNGDDLAEPEALITPKDLKAALKGPYALKDLKCVDDAKKNDDDMIVVLEFVKDLPEDIKKLLVLHQEKENWVKKE